MDKKFYSPPNEVEITAFAEKHLSPYVIRNREVLAKTCPFCKGGENGDTGTFFVSLDTGQYCCHRGKCGVRGGWIKLLRRFGEAPNIQSVSQQFKPLDIELLPRTDAINEYFANRGISEQTLQTYQVSADGNGNIIFPFFIEGELIYVKYRKPVPNPGTRKEWAEANTPPVLFGMDLCDPSEPLIIQEGEIDSLSLYEAGIRNAVSVPTGCENFQWIDPCYDWLEQFSKIILFGDNDAPGRKMVKTLVKRLGDERCFIVEDYPPGCKDANDILLNCGSEVLVNTLSAAKETPIRNIVDLADVKFIDPTTVPRIRTMIPALDESINGLEEGSLVLISGDSGSGKSTLSGTFLLNAIEQGWPVCAYSGELTSSQYFYWTTLQAAGSDWITLKHDPVKNKQVPVVYPPALERIRDWLRGKFFLFDCSEEGEAHVGDAVLEAFNTMAKRKGCKLFLADNLMTAIADSEDEEYRAQGKFVTALKRFAQRYGVTVLLVAHPRKTKADAYIRKDDIAGNKMLTNLANSAIVVERPNLRIIKARDAGLERLIECGYCGDSRRIYQLDRGDLNSFSWDKTGLTPPEIKANTLQEYKVYTNNTQMF